MTQEMEAKHVYDLDDLKKFKESGASAEEVREASAMMAKNKERREKATEELLNLNWETVSLDRVKDLVERGADVKAKGDCDYTPLHWASGRGRLDVVKCLVEHGADVKAEDKDGKTPFRLAATARHIEIVQYLDEHLAKKNVADVHVKNKEGSVALSKEYTRGNDVSISIVNPALMKNKGR